MGPNECDWECEWSLHACSVALSNCRPKKKKKSNKRGATWLKLLFAVILQVREVNRWSVVLDLTLTFTVGNCKPQARVNSLSKSSVAQTLGLGVRGWRGLTFTVHHLFVKDPHQVELRRDGKCFSMIQGPHVSIRPIKSRLIKVTGLSPRLDSFLPGHRKTCPPGGGCCWWSSHTPTRQEEYKFTAKKI